MPPPRLAVVSSHPIQYQAPLFRELARRDIHLSVLFCCEHGTKPSFDPGFGRAVQFDVPLLEGYPFEFLPNIARRPRVGTTGLINPTLVARIVRGDYDALVLHGYNTVTSILAYATPRILRRTRLLLRGDSNALDHRPPVVAAGKQLVLPMVLRRFDHFLVSGMLNREYYERFGVPDERMTLAPFSVDNSFFMERSSAARANPVEARRALGIPSDRPLFLFVAKLMPHKRPLDALMAFATARRTGTACLAFVGDGEQRSLLESEARRLGVQDDVFMLGFRNQSDLPAIYGCADALILPSVLEPWGLVVNEAMASGLAIAASRTVGASADLVRDNGATFAPGDVDALARILETWIQRPELLARHKASSFAHIGTWGIRETADGFLLGVERALRASSRP